MVTQKRWNGIQTFRLAGTSTAARRAVDIAVFANQLRTVDILLFEEYVKALDEGQQRLADFLFQRFRPEMKAATEAGWSPAHRRIPPPLQHRSPCQSIL